MNPFLGFRFSPFHLIPHFEIPYFAGQFSSNLCIASHRIASLTLDIINCLSMNRIPQRITVYYVFFLISIPMNFCFEDEPLENPHFPFIGCDMFDASLIIVQLHLSFLLYSGIRIFYTTHIRFTIYNAIKSSYSACLFSVPMPPQLGCLLMPLVLLSYGIFQKLIFVFFSLFT